MAARAALAESAPGVDAFVLGIFRELFRASREFRARRPGLFDLPSPLRCSRGSGSGARFCRRQKTSTLLPAHPVRSEVSKCARQVSWLAARSRFLWPSRGVSLSGLTKNEVHFACGLQLRGQLRIRDHLRSSHRIPFSSRFRANRCTTRCCVPRHGNCQQLVFGRVMKKFFKWLGFVAVGARRVVLLGLRLRPLRLRARVGAPIHGRRNSQRSSLPTDAGEIEEGHRLAHITGCTHCHGANLAGGPPIEIPPLVEFRRAEHHARRFRK